MLAKVLKNGGNLIVLDEPTNDLDLQSLRMLEEAVADFDGSVLVVSHDRYFLDRICDQIIAFEDDGVTVQAGNYSYYLEKRQAREAAARAQAAAYAQLAASKQKSAGASGKTRKLTLAERKELESMEETILTAEEKVSELETQLNDPEFQAKHFNEIPALAEKLDAAKARTAELYKRWEDLEAVAGNS